MTLTLDLTLGQMTLTLDLTLGQGHTLVCIREPNINCDMQYYHVSIVITVMITKYSMTSKINVFKVIKSLHHIEA